MPPKQVQPSPGVAASFGLGLRRPGRAAPGTGSRGARRRGCPGRTLLPVRNASCVEVRVEQEAAVVVGADAVGRRRRVGLAASAASSAARPCAAASASPASAVVGAVRRPRRRVVLDAAGAAVGGPAASASGRCCRRGRSSASASAATGEQRRRGAAHPGGQAIDRPPSTCRWAWKTVWCAAGAGVEHQPVALAETLRLRDRARPRRTRSTAVSGSPAASVGGVRRSGCAGPPARGSAPAGSRSRKATVVSVSCDHVGRDVAGDDLAEQAVGRSLTAPSIERRTGTGV